MKEELFQKFVDGLCGISERVEVIEWLSNCTGDELDILLKKRWDDGIEQMPAQLSADILVHIRSHIKPETAVVYPLWQAVVWKWMAVACGIGAIIVGYFLLEAKKPSQLKDMVLAKATLSAKKRTSWIIFQNRQATPREVMLADKTVVILYGNTTLQLPDNFNTTERPVYLSGKALFTVAKDKSRPFTVYSNNISTRAVGTRFLVNYDKLTSHVDIRLLEGIIEIRSTSKTAAFTTKTLHAGEEVHFGYSTTPNPLSAQHARDIVANTEKQIADEISFSNTPLMEVFTRMEQLYHVKIEYTKKDLTNMTLTSSISKNEDAESLLKLIGQMHGLSISRSDTSFIVTSKPTKK